MALPPAVNIGTAPNSGNGDPNRTSFDKLNKRDDWLDANKAPVDSPKIQTRLDLAAAAFSASFRDDGSGNLGWYVGAAGAADGAQVKVASVDKATGEVALSNEASDKVSLSVSGFGYRLVAAGTEGYNGFASLRRGGDGLETVRIRSAGVSFFNSGNVGIGTSSPGMRLHVVASDTPTALMFVGATKGIRFGFDTGGSKIEGVDSTGVGSFQPLTLSGSGVYIGNNLSPTADNTFASGTASLRWSVVYAGTGTINTSDAREKVTVDGEDITEATGWSVTPPTEAELRVARRLLAATGFYKFKDAVATKGLDKARRHFGLTVQFALQVCDEEGVDPWSIGIFCRDEITRKVMRPQTVSEQKTEPVEPELVIEIIDGIPTQVLREREPQPVFEMKPVIGRGGEVVMQTVIVEGASGFPVERQEPLLHPVPVMIEVTREVEIEEPAGERLGFRYDQLALFMMAGLVPTE
ncbi:hypothetical protein [Bosea sp. TAF32]|uniref:hypothetical protein n=1 Tax=Bosea sp. TAF32 TaxID=3237482 RepID=UPI003F92DB3E